MSTGRLTATCERWVNAPAEFYFSLHYKPDKQNTIADTLSHKSEQTHLENIQSCTETVPVEMVKIFLDRSDLTQENQEPLAVCLNTGIKEQTNILDNLTTGNKCFTIDDIQKGERAEYWIPRVKEILKQPARLSCRNRRNESKEVQQLLRQESKLFISGDVLYRKYNEQHHVVLPHALMKAVYRELHITWFILVQIELYSSSEKGYTGQKWMKRPDILSTINVHVYDKRNRTYRVRLHYYL